MAPLKKILIHLLEGAGNSEAAVLAALREAEELSTGLRIDAEGAEFVVGVLEPSSSSSSCPGGRYAPGRTEVIVADQALKVFGKVHVLPYLDTFRYNNDHMYFEHIKPYFDERQAGEFTVGFDFSHKGVRFSVVGVEPADSFGVVGKNTVVFFEGPPIERKVLDRVQLVPFEEGLPDKYRPTKLSLDEAALVRDFLKPYFEQRSAEISTGQTLEIQGVKFKVVATKPSSGGGFGRDTELACQGIALKTAFQQQQQPSQPKYKPKARPKSSSAASAAATLTGAGGQNHQRPADTGGGGGQQQQQQCTVS